MGPSTSGGARKRSALIPPGRWFGIEAGADGTWLIIFLLITLSYESRSLDLRREHEEVPTWASWARKSKRR
jgi:hypothetical protein